MRSRPRLHRSKRLARAFATFLLIVPGWVVLGALPAACHKDPTVVVRTVVVNVPSACPASGDAYATFHELGDFEPAPPAAGHYLDDVGAALPEIDTQARALVVEATEAAEGGQGEATWEGVADVPSSGDVNVLVLPELSSCALGTVTGARTGATLAAIAPGSVMLAGGPGTSAPTYVANLEDGSVARVTEDLLTPRSHASVTPFGTGALVAGGVDSGGTVLQTAEVYDPGIQGFDQQHGLMMSAARTEHGSVVLATGETLLVGGLGANGAVLATMEAIDPSTRIVRAEGVAQLVVPRRDPRVMVLASGEVFVAGGYDVVGAPVETLEWFSSDVSRATRAPQDLAPIGGAQAFVALEAGGALAVVGPAQGAGSCSYSVWQISADGVPQAAPPVACITALPVLFGGAMGAPVLWTGDRWLRWQPWSGSFGALDVLGDQPTSVGDVACAPDPGLAIWLDSSLSLRALRFDTRNVYSTLPGSLLVSAPSELAPDRLPLAGVASFDTQTTGELDLGPGSSAYVTDRTYADVAIDVEMPTAQPAMVVLRDATDDEVAIGGTVGNVTCFPGLSGPSQLHVERHGASVSWSVAGQPSGDSSSGTCAAPFDAAARVSVGLRGQNDGSTSAARNLRVTRLTPGAP